MATKGGNPAEYYASLAQLGGLIDAVKGIRNGLDKDESHLKVGNVQKIYKIYDDLTTLVQAYGNMSSSDLKEFNQLMVNIQEEDEGASQ